MINPIRGTESERERLSVFIDSPTWIDILKTVEEDVIRPLRSKALNDPALDPREHTGVVRALQAVRQVIQLPYERLAKATGKKLDEVLPQEVKRLFP